MRISQAIIERALRADLPALVAEHGIKLKKVGAEHKGLCPFHDEKTPSFQVNPQKGLYHCFGCGAAGNAITFLVKHKQVTFPVAVNELLQRQGTSLAALEPVAATTAKRSPAMNTPAAPPAKPTAKAAPAVKLPASADTAPATGSPSRAELLQQVMAFYRRTFAGTPTGAEYLAGRGIASRELYETFQIGYADGSLPGTLSKGSAMRAGLREAGLLTAAGKEFFAGCVVFPLMDENRRCAGFYGRRVKTESGKPNHLYLPGPHRGLFNREAAKRSKRVILTESIIDALSAIARGCDNIIPLYGTNGMTDEHVALLQEHGTEEIVFAFDADAAGETAIPRTMQRLGGLPLSFRKLALPPGDDLNDYIRKNANGSLAELIEQAQPIVLLPGDAANGTAVPAAVLPAMSGLAATATATAATATAATVAAPSVVEYSVTEDGSEIDMTAGELGYTVRGLNYFGFTRMKVTIRARRGTSFHIDTLDLYANRSRAGFVNQCAKRLDVGITRIEADIFQLIRELEKIREKHVAEQKDKNTIEIPPMSEDGRQEALRFLESPDLAREIVADMTTLGYVGEETNKIIGYLVSVSRKLAEPLSCIVISRSGAGKSELMEKVEHLTPPEDLVQFSSLTPQALYYMEPDALVHKLLLIEERAGSDQADYSIRELQTKKVLRKGVPLKDPSTGKITTVRLEVHGPIAYMESTTNHNINPENASRCFLLHIDESLQQTKKIHEAQRRARTLAGLEQRLRSARLIDKHQNAQRLLEPVAVFNPFCELLDFPTDRLRTRRDHMRFLNLIEAVTFLHQRQRPRREATDKTTGEVINYVESTTDDYTVAYHLIKAILPATLDEIPKSSRDLLALIREYCQARAKTELKNESEVTFTRRELREHCRWSNDQIKNHIRLLEELEYLTVERAVQGQTFRYRLATEAAAPEDITRQIPTPEELQKRMEMPVRRIRKVV